MSVQTLLEIFEIAAFIDRNKPELFAGLYAPPDKVLLICSSKALTNEILSKRSVNSLAKWKQLCRAN